jgi:drug/metabolite transporter (DMT)-like permease
MRVPTWQLFAVAVGIWGTTWLAITFQLGRVPPEASVAWRFALASLVAVGVCRARGHALRLPARAHRDLLPLGLFMFCAGYLAVYHAETLLVSGLVAVGYSASPLVNLAVSRVAFGTRATAGVAVGGLMGVAGIALVFWPEISRAEAGAGALAGGALTAAGVLSSSIGNVFATRLDRLGVNVWQKMAWGMAYGAAGCAAAALASGQGLSFQWTPGYVLSLLYLAFLGSIGAFAAYLTLLARVGAARAGYVGVMTPIVALAISGIVERFSWGPLTLAGVAVAVAGNVVMLRSR